MCRKVRRRKKSEIWNIRGSTDCLKLIDNNLRKEALYRQWLTCTVYSLMVTHAAERTKEIGKCNAKNDDSFPCPSLDQVTYSQAFWAASASSLFRFFFSFLSSDPTAALAAFSSGATNAFARSSCRELVTAACCALGNNRSSVQVVELLDK